MSDDIVQRLRDTGDDWPACLLALEREAADEIERLRALVEWRPIEAAPRDGTEVDLWVAPYTGRCYRAPCMWFVSPNKARAGFWRNGANTMIFMDNASQFSRPTHWRPIGPGPGDAP